MDYGFFSPKCAKYQPESVSYYRTRQGKVVAVTYVKKDPSLPDGWGDWVFQGEVVECVKPCPDRNGSRTK